jgi:SNF2 family DNA or RNA helicase
MALDKFIHNEDCRIFIGSIPAAGTGLDGLQSVCRQMVIAELIWVGVKLIQVEKRLHRLGQKHPVNITYLVAKNTVESMLCNAIVRKQKAFNSIIDGRSDRVEFDLLKAVMKRFTKKRGKY